MSHGEFVVKSNIPGFSTAIEPGTLEQRSVSELKKTQRALDDLKFYHVQVLRNYEDATAENEILRAKVTDLSNRLLVESSISKHTNNKIELENTSLKVQAESLLNDLNKIKSASVIKVNELQTLIQNEESKNQHLQKLLAQKDYQIRDIRIAFQKELSTLKEKYQKSVVTLKQSYEKELSSLKFTLQNEVKNLVERNKELMKLQTTLNAVTIGLTEKVSSMKDNPEVPKKNSWWDLFFQK